MYYSNTFVKHRSIKIKLIKRIGVNYTETFKDTDEILFALDFLCAAIFV